MSGKVGLLFGAQRHTWNSMRAIWSLYAFIVICEAALLRGFLLAAAADSAVFSSNLGPQNLAGISHDLLQMTIAWTKGAFHPSNLESWQRSSFPISVLAISALALSIYLRKKRP